MALNDMNLQCHNFWECLSTKATGVTRALLVALKLLQSFSADFTLLTEQPAKVVL